MKQSVIRSVFILAALLLAAGPAQGVARAQAPAELEAAARAVITALAAGEYEQVFARFDDRMKQAMSVEKLAQLWPTLQRQAGAFREITGTRLETRQGYRVVVVTLAFALLGIDASVVFDAEGRISGLNFAPAARAEEWKPPAYAQPETFREVAVTVGEAPWQLSGTLTLPRGEGRFPAVVLVHGSGPHDQDETIGPNRPFKDLAWGLASRGVAVLRYTKRTRAHGARLGEGFDTFTINEETVYDARAAVRLLAAREEIDPRRIFVLGHSLGGYMAPRIAEDQSVPVAGLIVLAGSVRPLEELVVEQVRYLAGLEAEPSPQARQQVESAEEMFRRVRDPELQQGAIVEMLATKMPASYFLDLRGYRPAELAARLGLPMLILQGERDYQVTMTDFGLWRKALAGRGDVKLKSYPALNHLFHPGKGMARPQEYLAAGYVDEEVVADIAAWVLAQRPRP